MVGDSQRVKKIWLMKFLIFFRCKVHKTGFVNHIFEHKSTSDILLTAPFFFINNISFTCQH